jgi:hypothetical protein
MYKQTCLHQSALWGKRVNRHKPHAPPKTKPSSADEDVHVHNCYLLVDRMLDLQQDALKMQTSASR